MHKAVGHISDVNRGPALWKVLHDASEASEVPVANTMTALSILRSLAAEAPEVYAKFFPKVQHAQPFAFVAECYSRRIELREAAELVHLTEAAFCRSFKRMTRLTFTQFVNRYRVHEAQRLLLTDHSVTEAAFACGFESLSYFNRVFRGVTGENPLAFKRRHRSDS